MDERGNVRTSRGRWGLQEVLSGVDRGKRQHLRAGPVRTRGAGESGWGHTRAQPPGAGVCCQP